MMPAPPGARREAVPDEIAEDRLQIGCQTVNAEVTRPLEEWAETIRSDLTGAVEGLIAAGRHLLAARAQHPGTFVAWVATEPFGVSQRQSYYLMQTAEAFSGLQSFANLPADRTALYQLARLEPPQLTEAIGAGAVTPDMGRTEAKAVVALYRAKGPQPKPETRRPTRGSRRKSAQPVDPDQIVVSIVDGIAATTADWRLQVLGRRALATIDTDLRALCTDRLRDARDKITALLDLLEEVST